MTNWGDPNGAQQPAWTSPDGSREQPQYGQYAPPGYAPPSGQQYGAPGYGPAPGYPQLVPKPGVVPLRPLLLGDIFEGAFRTVRGNPGATIGLSLIVTCVAAVPILLVTLGLSNIALGSGPSADALLPVVSYAGSAVAAVITTVLTGMLIVVVGEAVLGRRITVAETWSRVRGRIWALLGAVLLVGAVLLAGLAVLALVCVAAYAAGGTTGLVVAVILSVLAAIPLVIFLQVRTSLATPAVTLERMSPVTALKRSWALTRGQFWRIFGITLLASIVASVVGAIVTVPASIVVAALAAASGDGTSVDALPMLLVMQAASLLAAALTTPFTASVTGLLYIDQRIRREALDVRLMAEAAKD